MPRFEQKTINWENNILHKFHVKLLHHVKTLLLDKGWLLTIIGFLLGRAIILTSVAPFSIAFLATIWYSQRNRALRGMIALMAGALTVSMLHTVYVVLGILVFICMASLMKRIKKQQVLMPFIAFISTVIPRLFIYSLESQLLLYEWMLLLVEGVLAAVLVLIFMQSIPLLSLKRYKPTLKSEEMVCMIILGASILTGTIGWQLFGASVEQILSRYFVLSLAFVGGAAIGSTVGVVAGLILSLANAANLYQMSLLAFSGLLGGLLKEGKKIGVSTGLLVGTALIAIYGDVDNVFVSLGESAFAIILFLSTPHRWLAHVAKFIPGTEEHTEEQEQYLQKIRNVTAERVEKFSNVFAALSKSFLMNDEQGEDEVTRRETDYFLSNVTESTCQRCFMKERCWQKEFDKTYDYMTQLTEDLSTDNKPNQQLLRDFANHCVKSKKVIDTMQEEMTFFNANQQLKKQVTESKRLVADQLQGVSKIMNDFAKEILKERENHEKQELQIIQALENLGIEIDKLEIYQLDKGNIDIEMTISFYEYRGEGPKLIAPVLSDILKELVIVKEERISPFPNGYCYLTFGSAKEFVVETGIANAARGGGLISGDSYTLLELGTGKYAMAISDGMGNGKRAHEESTETLRLLQQILQTGIPEKVAIKSINSILSLRSTDEIFATLDLAIINLHNAFVRFLKIGSTPSFIKRGDKIINIEASNLPMGILPDFDIDIVSEQLKAGDILVMMSDGIFDGPKHVENKELWLKRKIRSMKTNHPQEIADLLLEEVIRARSGEIADDMTVLVAKIAKNTPQWATIPIYDKTKSNHA